MTSKRSVFYTVLILGLILILIETAISFKFELNMVNEIGILFIVVGLRGLRAQENHIFLDYDKPPEKWLKLKRDTGFVLCAVGLSFAFIASTYPVTINVFRITTNIATIFSIEIFLFGAGKISKIRVLTRHNKIVIRILNLFTCPSTDFIS